MQKILFSVAVLYMILQLGCVLRHKLFKIFIDRDSKIHFHSLSEKNLIFNKTSFANIKRKSKVCTDGQWTRHVIQHHYLDLYFSASNIHIHFCIRI